MVRSEVYLNKYVVSIAPFTHPNSENFPFCMFSRFSFSSIYPGGSADPICPYVQTPMCKRMLRGRKAQGGERE